MSGQFVGRGASRSTPRTSCCPSTRYREYVIRALPRPEAMEMRHLRRPRAGAGRGRHRARAAARLRQLRDGRVRGAGRGRRRRPSEHEAVELRVIGEVVGGCHRRPVGRAGPGDADHDRRPAAARRRRGRAGRGHLRRGLARSPSTGPPSGASTSARSARTSARGQRLLARGRRVGPGRHRAAARLRGDPGAVLPVPARGGDVDRRRARARRPRTRHRPDPRLQRADAGRAGPPGRWRPVRHRSGRTTGGRSIDALESNLGHADMVLMTGGVSAGVRDLVADVIAQLGEAARFKVAMQPGMPQVVGRVGDVPVLGLPGNPVSTFVSFEVFVRPALRVLQGRRDLLRPAVTAALAADVDQPTAQALLPAGAGCRGTGRAGWPRPTGRQGSHVLTSHRGRRRAGRGARGGHLDGGRRPDHRPPAGRRSEHRRRPAGRRAELTHLDASGRARMVDVGDKDVTRALGRRGLPGRDVAGDRRAAGRRGPAQGRRAARGPARRHPGGQAHPRADPAVPPGRADLGGRRGRRGRRGAGRPPSRRRPAPPTAPASRWRRWSPPPRPP